MNSYDYNHKRMFDDEDSYEFDPAAVRTHNMRSVVDPSGEFYIDSLKEVADFAKYITGDDEDNYRRGEDLFGDDIDDDDHGKRKEKKKHKGGGGSSSKKRKTDKKGKKNPQRAAAKAVKKGAYAEGDGDDDDLDIDAGDDEEDDDDALVDIEDRETKREAMIGFKGSDLENWKHYTGQLIDNDPTEKERIDKLREYMQQSFDKHVTEQTTFFGQKEHYNTTVRKTQCVICAYTALNPLDNEKMTAFHAMMLTDLTLIGTVQGNQLMQNCADAFNSHQKGVENDGGKLTHRVDVFDVKKHLLGCSIGNPLRPLDFQIRLCRQIIEKGAGFIFGKSSNGEEEGEFWNANKTKLLLTIMKYEVMVSKEFWSTKTRLMHALNTGEMPILKQNSKIAAAAKNNNNRHVAGGGSKSKYGGLEMV